MRSTFLRLSLVTALALATVACAGSSDDTDADKAKADTGVSTTTSGWRITGEVDNGRVNPDFVGCINRATSQEEANKCVPVLKE